MARNHPSRINRRRLLGGLAGLAGAAVCTPALAATGATFLWPGGEGPGTVVIETSDRTLFLVRDDATAVAWPVAVGRDGRQWTGRTSIVRKAVDPTWYPTPRMRREDPSLPASVGPGPSNPFGTRALYLAQGLLRIHGTNAPSSIGREASSGCFRMHNSHVEELYRMVGPGTPVVVRR